MARAQHVAELVHHHAGEIALADAVADHIDEAAAVRPSSPRGHARPSPWLGDRMAAVDPGHDPAARALDLGQHLARADCPAASAHETARSRSARSSTGASPTRCARAHSRRSRGRRRGRSCGRSWPARRGRCSASRPWWRRWPEWRRGESRRSEGQSRSPEASRSGGEDAKTFSLYASYAGTGPPIPRRISGTPAGAILPGPQTLEPHAERLVQPRIVEQPRRRLVGDHCPPASSTTRSKKLKARSRSCTTTTDSRSRPRAASAR